jgi:hypothetical protein
VARTFNGSSDSITLTATALPALQNFTAVAVCRITTNPGFAGYIFGWDVSGSSTGSLGVDSSGNMKVVVASSSGISPTSPISSGAADGWILYAITKTSGTSTIRFHRYLYASDTWARGNSTATAGDTTAPTRVRLGNDWFGSNAMAGDLAAAAIFNTTLTDDQVSSLPFSLANWLSLAPVGMWVTDQSNVAQTVIDWTGRGTNETARSGSTVSTASVPLLGYGHPVVARTRQAPPPDPQFAGSGTLLSGTGSSAALAVPSGVVANDIIVITLFADGGSTTVTPPSGFAHAENSPVTGAGNHSLNILWKRATGADSGTYTASLSASVYREGAAHRYTGAVTSGAPFDAGTGSASTTTSGTVTPAVSTTTLGANRKVLFAATDWSGGSWTPPALYAERMDGGVGLVTLDDVAQPSAGSTGSVSATSTGNDKRTAWIGALIPAGATGTTTTLTVAPGASCTSGTADSLPLGSVTADQPGASLPSGGTVTFNFGVVQRAQLSGNNTGTTITVTLPTYLTTDFVALVVASNNGNAQTFSSNVTATALANAGNRVVAYRIVPQDGAQTTFTFTVGASSVFSWWIASYSGANLAATVYGANNQIGNSTSSTVVVPQAELPFLATGNEMVFSAAGVNSTATWTTTGSTVFNTTSGNAALQVRATTATSGHLVTVLPNMDRGSNGSSRNQNAVAFVLQPTGQSVTSSLLANGSFEAGTTVAASWQIEGTVAGTPAWTVQSTSGVSDGTKAQQVQYTGQAGDTSKMLEIFQAPIPASPGQVLQFAIWMSGTQTACAGIIGIEAFDSGNAYLSETDANVVLTGTSTQYTVTYTCPAGTDHVAVYAQFNEIVSTSAVTAYFDQATLLPVTGGTSLIVQAGSANNGAAIPGFSAGFVLTAQPGASSPSAATDVVTVGTNVTLNVQPGAATTGSAQVSLPAAALLAVGPGAALASGTGSAVVSGVALSASSGLTFGSGPASAFSAAAVLAAQPGMSLGSAQAASLTAGIDVAPQPAAAMPGAAACTFTAGVPGATTLTALPGTVLPSGAVSQQATGSVLAARSGSAAGSSARPVLTVGLTLAVTSAATSPSGSVVTLAAATTLFAWSGAVLGGSGGVGTGSSTTVIAVPGLTAAGGASPVFTARQVLSPLTGAALGGGSRVTVTGTATLLVRPGILTPAASRSDPSPGSRPYPRLTPGTVRGPSYSGG